MNLDKINKDTVREINDKIEDIKTSVKLIFKNFYEKPLLNIPYATSTQFKDEDVMMFKETITIEAEDCGSFFIDINYLDGEFTVDYEDNINDYGCHLKNKDYKFQMECYKCLNAIAVNVKKIQVKTN